MGTSQSGPENRHQDLADKTGFSPEQIRNLHDRFQCLTQGEDTLRREHLENIDNLNLGETDKGCVLEIGFEEFVKVLAFFRPPKPRTAEDETKSIRKQKLRFLFNMHDSDNDGVITLDEYRRVVEELLSSYETIEAETAKAISDAAMLEVASVTVGQMGPDEFYEGITFEQFMQILKDLEIETKMNIHFRNLDTSTMHCGK
ncbi:hypothetical protein DNTS_035319 [Danionella cerebrum]|uniref:Calcineurin B homologous protein 3 n=1 Tax=Danionella cerebrum TaxID=2873325 RepID=A0A553QC44_9TELE|nr:hypothetical protein DNTS_035319 [Danionella translucida]